MEKLDLKALKILCMHGVVHEPGEYSLRYIFRWYSREFSTPLTEVEDIPLEDVMRHYFESRYEDLEEEDREKEIERLLMPEEKLARLRKAEDAEDVDAFEFGRDSEEAAPLPAPVVEGPTDPITARLERIREAVAETKPPTHEPFLEEGIHMTFDDFDEDKPGFGPPDEPGNLD